MLNPLHQYFQIYQQNVQINLTTTVRNIHLKFEPQVRDMQINILILLLRAYKFEYF